MHSPLATTTLTLSLATNLVNSVGLGSIESFDGSGLIDVSNPCDPNPCRNGGKCKVTDSNDFECKCRKHSTGKKCQIFDFSSFRLRNYVFSWRAHF